MVKQKRQLHHSIIGRSGAPAAKDDPEAKEMFQAIGYALSLWNGIEEIVSLCYGRFLGGHEVAIAKGHSSIISMESRLDVFQGSTDWILRDDPTRLDCARKFIASVKKSAALRNQLAHGSVNRITVEYLGKASLNVCVVSPGSLSHKQNYDWMHPKYEYDVRDIKALSEHYETMHEQLWRRYFATLQNGPLSFFDDNCAPAPPNLSPQKYLME